MKLTIIPTVPQAENLNFYLSPPYIQSITNPNTCIFPVTLPFHGTIISSRWLEQPANMIYKILHALAFTQLFGLIFILSNLPSLTMQNCDIELLCFVITSCFTSFPYLKHLFLNISFPFMLMFTHLSGFNLDVASSESIPESYPTCSLNEVPFPLFLEAPKAPCTSFILVLDFIATYWSASFTRP